MGKMIRKKKKVYMQLLWKNILLSTNQLHKTSMIVAYHANGSAVSSCMWIWTFHLVSGAQSIADVGRLYPDKNRPLLVRWDLCLVREADTVNASRTQNKKKMQSTPLVHPS